MPTEVEGTHDINGTSLYTKSWLVTSPLHQNIIKHITNLSKQPDGPPIAKIIFIHGFNDHINRYQELFTTLASRSIATYSFDQRGWGQSVRTPSDKGKTGPTSLVISDTAHFISSHLPSDIPLFVMGHSMGGGQVLTLASDPKYDDLVRKVDGWILESPFIAFPKGFAPNPIEVFLGKLAARVLPAMQRYSALPAETVTRDPAVIASIKSDPLLHGSGTLEGLSGMLSRATALGDGTVKISDGVERLWLGHGTKDQGTSYEASKNWFEKHGEKKGWTWKSYEGWSHQLHADSPETNGVFAKDVGDWVISQVEDIKKEGKTKSEEAKAGESKL